MLEPSCAPKRQDIPDTFGVYKWKDGSGRVIYVGKAKSLRNRLSFYFQPPSSLPPRTRSMVGAAKSLEWTVVDNELEALALEYSWIKEFDPKYNVVFKDDKSYPYLALSAKEEFPRLFVTRKSKRKGLVFFGPFANQKLFRLLGPLTQIFPLRTCSDESFKIHRAHNRACILYELGRCSGPCVGAVGKEKYGEIVKAFSSALTSPSRAQEEKAKLKREMEEERGDFNFEKAARARDELLALEEVTEKNSVLRSSGDEDVFAAASGEGICYFYQMTVRGGRIRAERSWSADFVEEETKEGLLSRLLFSFYSSKTQQDFEADRSSVPDNGFQTTRASWPKEVLVPFLPEDAEGIEEMLACASKRKVEVKVPKRGPKKSLLEEAQKNAEEGLKRLEKSSLKKSEARKGALEEAQKLLSLPSLPLLIEGFDISNSASGGQQVGSCVSFANGEKNAKGYRKFSLPSYKDDLGALEEVVKRRYEMDLPLPDLVLVDGGPEQLKAARRGLEEALGKSGSRIPLAALSKRLEEVWLEGEAYPLILSRTDPLLLLLENVRDESHRFAIAYHRLLRQKSLQEER
ncbi:MAG: excinuclease ABC subunit UvrC [Aeriscardovia sp.]|nr:excinuclease ABC subunit UvrC [Aeriscardovia sp.]